MTTDTMQRSATGSTTSSPARLQEAASDIAESAGQAAQTQASAAMQRAGDTLEQVATAVRDTGNQLRGDQPQIAGIADTAAQRIDQLATYIRERDAAAMIDDAERFARRQPAIVIGGGLALGLIVGRLLRSGAEPMDAGAGWRSGTAGRSSAWNGNGGSGSRTGWTGTGRAGSSSTPGTGYGTSFGSGDDAGASTRMSAASRVGSPTAGRGRTSSMPGSRGLTSDAEG